MEKFIKIDEIGKQQNHMAMHHQRRRYNIFIYYIFTSEL